MAPPARAAAESAPPASVSAGAPSSCVSPPPASLHPPTGSNVRVVAGQKWVEAAKRGDRAEMEALLRSEGGGILHYKARGIGHSALHWAAARGEIAIMRWLLSIHADVNARNASDGTPLHTAAAQGQAFALALLLEAGADTTLLNDDGVSAAQLAVAKGRDDLAREIHKYQIKYDNAVASAEEQGGA